MIKMCDKCKSKPATGFWSLTVNGKKQEMYLCENCLKQVENNLNFNKCSDDVFNVNKKRVKEKVCKTCGRTFSEFENNLFLGCADCYNAFKDELLPIIANIQGNNAHIGKVPPKKSVTNINSTNKDIHELQKKLNQAIKEERYLDAEKIHKKILNLKEQQNG